MSSSRQQEGGGGWSPRRGNLGPGTSPRAPSTGRRRAEPEPQPEPQPISLGIPGISAGRGQAKLDEADAGAGGDQKNAAATATETTLSAAENPNLVSELPAPATGRTFNSTGLAESPPQQAANPEEMVSLSAIEATGALSAEVDVSTLQVIEGTATGQEVSKPSSPFRKSYAGVYANGRFRKNPASSLDQLTPAQKQEIVYEIEAQRRAKVEELMLRQRKQAAKHQRNQRHEANQLFSEANSRPRSLKKQHFGMALLDDRSEVHLLKQSRSRHAPTSNVKAAQRIDIPQTRVVHRHVHHHMHYHDASSDGDTGVNGGSSPQPPLSGQFRMLGDSGGLQNGPCAPVRLQLEPLRAPRRAQSAIDLRAVGPVPQVPLMGTADRGLSLSASMGQLLPSAAGRWDPGLSGLRNFEAFAPEPMYGGLAQQCNPCSIHQPV